MKSHSGIGATRRGIARGLALGVLVGSAGLGMAVTAGPAHAVGPNNYDLQAQGDGMYILFANANLPAGLPGAISPYAASASTNSNAVSKGFAGAPYLGPLLQTLPGLVGGLSASQVPPLPPLPGFVETSTPSNLKQRQAQGPYLLESESDDTGSTATSGVGFAAQADGNPQAFAKANARASEDGSTLTQATAGISGAVIGPVTLLDVSTQVSVAADPMGKTTIVNQSNFGTISVAGIKLGLTESGFTILGANVAAPTKPLFDTINTVLAASKTKISLLQSTEAKDEASGRTVVQSGGLRMETIQRFPGFGDVNVDYVFARSTVRSINQPLGGSTGGATTDGGEAGATSGATGGATSGATSGATAGTTSGDIGGSGSTDGGFAPAPDLSTSGDVGTTGGDTSGEIPPPDFAPADTGSTSGDGAASGGGEDLTPQAFGNTGSAPLGQNTELLYLVLVLGGAGAFIGQQLFSRFGVQLMLRQS